MYVYYDDDMNHWKSHIAIHRVDQMTMYIEDVLRQYLFNCPSLPQYARNYWHNDNRLLSFQYNSYLCMIFAVLLLCCWMIYKNCSVVQEYIVATYWANKPEYQITMYVSSYVLIVQQLVMTVFIIPMGTWRLLRWKTHAKVNKYDSW